MGKGRVFNDPPFIYRDSYSGREIWQLTDYYGHSNHFYFTDPCWFNGNRSLAFTSDRENQSNLFRYDLDTACITQMTDLAGRGRPGGCVSQVTGEVYFWWGNKLHALHLETLEERILCEIEPPLKPRGRANPTADGKYVCSMLQDEPPEDAPRISFAYSRFREFFLARPLSQIIRVEVATGKVEVIYEHKCYTGHVNTSPTRPEILTYCHEGPWAEVEQRIWGLNIQTGETWKIRPQDGSLGMRGGLAIGHEYWFADGERMGYHGRPREGKGEHVFGHLRWDNTDHMEVSFPYHSTHFHSLDESMMVGDGTSAFRDHPQAFIQLFRWDGECYVGPKALAFHRSTFNNQHAHPHPRFTPDGRAVLYSSDLTAYSNMYLVQVGDFDDLPDLADVV